jgi:hypothetical protein
MLNIQIAEVLVDLESLDNEIKERHKLINEMVGTLWPSVVKNEIIILNKRREEIERIVKVNYEYYGKRRNN